MKRRRAIDGLYSRGRLRGHRRRAGRRRKKARVKDIELVLIPRPDLFTETDKMVGTGGCRSGTL